MRILVACEESQIVCQEFRLRGHEAYSCDIIECSGEHPEWHIKSDVLPFLDGYCAFETMDGTSHQIDQEWDMIGYTRYYHEGEKIEKSAEPFHAKLKIIHIGCLNNGCYFELQDENGKIYSMNDVMLRKYIKKMMYVLKEIGTSISKEQHLVLDYKS